MFYWDLFPFDDPFSAKFGMTEMDEDKFIFTFYGPKVQGFYDNPEYWWSSPQFNNSAYNEWWQQKYVQIGEFDPFHPTLANYIQFDKNRSKTSNTTVVFPRLENVSVLESNNQIIEPSTFEIAKPFIDPQSNRIGVIALFYRTTGGYTAFIRTDEGTTIIGDEKTLTVIWFDSSLNFSGISELLGPQTDLEPYYPSSADPPKILPGWGFAKIIGLNYRDGGVDLLASATFNKNRFSYGGSNVYFFHFSFREVFS